MKTTAVIRPILRRPLLLAALAGSLSIAFLAGATTAHTLLAPRPVDRMRARSEFRVASGPDGASAPGGRDRAPGMRRRRPYRRL